MKPATPEGVRLRWLPVNQAYAWTLGLQLIRMGNGPMFFPDRASAELAAVKQGLTLSVGGER